MNQQAEIAILLSTFNGAEFLKEQLDSILNQTYKSWKLFIRDDGSVDATLEILSRYKVESPEKIILVKDDLGNIGAKKSYAEIFNHARDFDYVAFSDQDDVWKPEKIKILLNSMNETEGPEKLPAAVFSDLEITDEKLNTISNSFFSYTNLSPKIVESNVLLFRNVVPGCSMMINKNLVSYIHAIPEKAVMHDYWIILAAHFLGKIAYVTTPLVKYRQHEKNALGAEKVKSKNLISVLKLFYEVIKNKHVYLQNFYVYINQLSEFYKIFGVYIKNSAGIQAVLSMPEEKSFMKRKFIALKYGLGYGNWLMNFEFFLCC